MSVPFDLRVGNGFDIHRVGNDGTMMLGGCEFPGVAALVGHSDGDVIAHAVADAVLGAAGLGDLGSWFPDTDPSFAGADSIELLRRVIAAIVDDGWRVANADCSVICDQPKLAPRRADMQARLGAAVGAPVSVKGRRPEGVGALGRGEAIVCFASVLLMRDGATAAPSTDHRARTGRAQLGARAGEAPVAADELGARAGEAPVAADELGARAGEAPAETDEHGVSAGDRSSR